MGFAQKKLQARHSLNLASQSLETISRQNVSHFCPHLFSSQQARLMLASSRQRKNI